MTRTFYARLAVVSLVMMLAGIGGLAVLVMSRGIPLPAALCQKLANGCTHEFAVKPDTPHSGISPPVTTGVP